MLAARENKERVQMVDFEKASERILAGLETKRTLSKEERKTVAYHEAGHAIVGWFLKHCSPIVKITIIPRSKGSLGFTQYLPGENQLLSKDEIIDNICMTLGGRMAEELFFNKVILNIWFIILNFKLPKITSGAADDLQRITKMARSLVTTYGMSSLGYRIFPENQDTFVKQYSEETDKLIDQEVRKIVDDCAAVTRELVRTYKDQIIKIAEKLLESETIDLLDMIELIGDRPHELPKSMKAYLNEIKERKKKKNDLAREVELANAREKYNNSDSDGITIKESESKTNDVNKNVNLFKSLLFCSGNKLI